MSSCSGQAEELQEKQELIDPNSLEQIRREAINGDVFRSMIDMGRMRSGTKQVLRQQGTSAVIQCNSEPTSVATKSTTTTTCGKSAQYPLYNSLMELG